MRPSLRFGLLISLALSAMWAARSQYLFNDGRISANDTGVLVASATPTPGPGPTPTPSLPPPIYIEIYSTNSSPELLVSGVPPHHVMREGFVGGAQITSTALVGVVGWSADPSGLSAIAGVPIQAFDTNQFVNETRASDSFLHLQNMGTGLANVVVTYNDGIIRNYAVSPETLRIIDNTLEGHAPSWQGWANLSSDQPITGGVRLEPPGGPRCFLPSMPGEDTTVVFPFLPKALQGETAGYRVQNCSTSTPLDISISFRRASGTNVFAPFPFTGIPAGEPASLNGVITSGSVGTNAFYNSTVTSTSGQPLAGLAEVDLGSGAFYKAIPLNQAGAEAHCPLVMAEPSPGYRSTIYIQNLQNFQIANLTYSLSGSGVDRQPTGFSGVLDPIPAHGTLAFPLEQVPGATNAVFVGSALIKAPNPAWDIAAVVVTRSDSDQFAYSALSENGLATRVALPAMVDTVPDVFLTNFVQTAANIITLEWEPVPSASGYTISTNARPVPLDSPDWTVVGAVTGSKVQLQITTATGGVIRVEPQ